MSQIPIQKLVFFKEDYNKVVNTQFNQLLKSQTEVEVPVFTIDDFFQLYEDLFYQIPKEGDANSHEYILKREADYLDVKINSDDVDVLLQEITTLRQELLEMQQLMNDLTKNNG